MNSSKNKSERDIFLGEVTILVENVSFIYYVL